MNKNCIILHIPHSSLVVPEKEKILITYYDSHHQKFEKLVDEKLKEYGEAFIIDCHSFNPYPLPHENDKTQRPDVCIGFDEFHADKELVLFLKDCFESKGYSVKIDSPFQGSIVPLKYYGRNKKVRSVMIELNRKLYMNKLGERTGNFQKLKADISEIILRLRRSK